MGLSELQDRRSHCAGIRPTGRYNDCIFILRRRDEDDLLPFHDEEAGRTALDAATLVAQRFGSYLEGLLVQETPLISFGRGMTVPADYLSEMTRQWRDFADARGSVFG